MWFTIDIKSDKGSVWQVYRTEGRDVYDALMQLAKVLGEEEE